MISHLSGRAVPLPAVAGLLGLAGASLIPSGIEGPTVCPFALLTGTACPGCGMSRALLALVHGDLTRTWELHPLAPLVLLEVVAVLVWWSMRRPGTSRPLSPPAAGFVVAATGLLLLAVWGVRLAGGSLPPV